MEYCFFVQRKRCMLAFSYRFTFEISALTFKSLLALFFPDADWVNTMPYCILESGLSGLKVSYSTLEATLADGKTLPAGFGFSGKLNILGYEVTTAIAFQPIDVTAGNELVQIPDLASYVWPFKKFEVLLEFDPIDLFDGLFKLQRYFKSFDSFRVVL